MQENRKNITNAKGFLRRTSLYCVYSVVCHVYNQAFSQEVFTIYKQAFLIGSLTRHTNTYEYIVYEIKEGNDWDMFKSFIIN